jgi:signal transduction histidine kinase
VGDRRRRGSGCALPGRSAAARATERNRIAREIHDSVGHALSVVTVQASAARKLIERDPGFAADALATIETASRRAVSELAQDFSQQPGGRPASVPRGTGAARHR